MRNLWRQSRYWFWWDLWIGSRAGDCIIHHDRLISVHVEKPKKEDFWQKCVFFSFWYLWHSPSFDAKYCQAVQVVPEDWVKIKKLNIMERPHVDEIWLWSEIRNCALVKTAVIRLVNKKVLPLSMDFSKAQTPGRGESAIVTTTYAT